jgi:hypothetical protein
MHLIGVKQISCFKKRRKNSNVLRKDTKKVKSIQFCQKTNTDIFFTYLCDI